MEDDLACCCGFSSCFNCGFDCRIFNFEKLGDRPKDCQSVNDPGVIRKIARRLHRTDWTEDTVTEVNSIVFGCLAGIAMGALIMIAVVLWIRYFEEREGFCTACSCEIILGVAIEANCYNVSIAKIPYPASAITDIHLPPISKDEVIFTVADGS